jgi:hypothetical protein
MILAVVLALCLASSVVTTEYAWRLWYRWDMRQRRKLLRKALRSLGLE